MKLVFCLQHAGFLRYYRPVIELLADRGHSVHLGFTVLEKDEGDARLAEELASAHAGVTFGLAPRRARRDPLRLIARLARSLRDLARYGDPRYADAPELRARAAREVSAQLRAARFGALGTPLVRYVSRSSSARVSQALAGIERALPTSRRVDRWLRELGADAVLVSPAIDFGSSQVEYLKSARSLGIPSAVCVASWDNLTGKGLIRVGPDRVFVWNEIQRAEAVELHGIPGDRVVATGAPKFDEWFARSPSTTAEQFSAKVGLPGRFVLYLCSSPFIAPDEVPFVRDWLRALREGSDTPVLVRPHPQNAAQWRDVDLSELGPVAIWPRAGAQPDAGEARSDFYDSLAHSTAVVGLNTSALIEAAIVGRPVFTILDDRFAGTQEGTLHFHYLRAANGGFLHEATSFAEHLQQLGAAGQDEVAGGFVESFVRPRGLDRPAAPILADEIEALVPGRR